MATDEITQEQKRHGTYRERFLQVKKEFHQLIEEGGDNATVEGILIKILKDMEDIRLKNELDSRRLEQQLAVCQATARACSTYSNLVVSAVSYYRRELKKTPEAVQETEKSSVPKDTDVLKTICLCGCQDEEDAAGCQCVCHTKGWCDRPDCTVCRQKEAEAKKPVKKAPARKKAAKKRVTKKATKKKTTRKK